MSKAKQTGRLPCALDAEASILGGILLRPDVIDRIANLETDHYYDPRHRAVWEAIVNVRAKGLPVDVVTVEESLRVAGKIDAIGGTAFLGELALRVPTPDNVVAYAQIVIQRWRWRQVALDAATLLDQIRDGAIVDESDPILEIQEIAARAVRARPHSWTTMSAAVSAEAARASLGVDRRESGEVVHTGIPFGFRDFDGLIGGAPLATVTQWLGLRGGAKTTASQTAASNAARILAQSGGIDGRKVVVYAYAEDSAPMFAQRQIAAAGGGAFSTESIVRLSFGARDQRFSMDGFRAFLRAASRAASDPAGSLVLLKVSGMHGDQVASLMRQANAELGVAAFFLDYLQKLRSPPGIKNKLEAVAANSQAMSEVASDTGAAMIVMAQLKPEIENRDWKEGGPIPRLGDTRWGLDIENDARLVIANFDRWRYGKPGLGGQRFDPQNVAVALRDDVIELHTLKRTMGAADFVMRLRWLRACAYVGDLDDGDDGTAQGVLSTGDEWTSRYAEEDRHVR